VLSHRMWLVLNQLALLWLGAADLIPALLHHSVMSSESLQKRMNSNIVPSCW